jgi:hypothetical protein
MGGGQREAELKRQAYFSEHYFSLIQLITFAQKIHDIHQLTPKNIIEISIDNGFTSSFLKSSRHDSTTCDIDAHLNPDIVSPVQKLPEILSDKRFGLAVCCEVLEHIPFSEFESATEPLAKISSRLYLTLPNYSKFFGFNGLFDVPRFRRLFNFGIFLPIPRKSTPEHFWELGSTPETSVKEILKVIKRHFPSITHRTYRLNRYHHVFICVKE